MAVSFALSVVKFSSLAAREANYRKVYIVAEVGWNNFMTTKSNSNLEGHQREEETDGTKIQQQQLGTFITIVVGEAKNINGISRL